MSKNPDTTDLNEPSAPDGIPDVLRRAAEKMCEQAAELQAAWGDRRAGRPWMLIAKELDKTAFRIERLLEKE